jgi:hypothetical protein
MEKACKDQNFNGPVEFTGKEVFAGLPGDIPKPYGKFDETVVGGGNGGSKSDEKGSTSTVPATTSAAAAAPTATASPQKPVDEGAGKTPEPPKDEEEEYDGGQPDQSPAEESPALKISTDGRCGGTTGQTCKGSTFGECCSRKGRCGRKTRHCTCGCQKGFGECKE